MKTFQLGEVFIEREFEFQSSDGAKVPVKLYLYKPYPEPEFRRWCCVRQIIGIGPEKIRAGYGIDALHALQLTLQVVKVELESMAKRRNGTLIWLGMTDLDLPEKPAADSQTSGDSEA